jgi:hypothetical protein
MGKKQPDVFSVQREGGRIIVTVTEVPSATDSPWALFTKYKASSREIVEWLRNQLGAPEVEFKYEQQQQTRGAVGVSNRDRARKKG